MARATCALGAAPEAVTARLTSAGATERSATRCRRPARHTAARACPMRMAVRGIEGALKMSSMITRSGANRSRTLRAPSNSASSRTSSGSRALVRMTPVPSTVGTRRPPSSAA